MIANVQKEPLWEIAMSTLWRVRGAAFVGFGIVLVIMGLVGLMIGDLPLRNRLLIGGVQVLVGGGLVTIGLASYWLARRQAAARKRQRWPARQPEP